VAHYGHRANHPGLATGVAPGRVQIAYYSAAFEIRRHSNEVWKVLAAAKTDFGKLGGILDKVSKKLQETQNVIDVEVGRHRRATDSKLKGIELLPEIEAVAVLELDSPEEGTEEAERYAAE
jgi:DNA anti-recombination protein RmuC